MSSRKPEFEIDPMFHERWSPRSFTKDELPDSVLQSALEAARWSPSSANSQPWRFVFSKRGSKTWDQFVGFLADGNVPWAKNASALVVLLSKKDFKWGDKVTNSPSHSFDTGAAWMSFAFQLRKLGWATHGMGGILRDKITTELHVPANFNIEMMIAIGKPGNAADLPEPYRAREIQSDRMSQKLFASDGVLPIDWTKNS